MIEKLKNCPQCAGILNEAGRCEFCGSKVYDFLTIDFNDRDMPSAKTYIRLKVNGKVALAPVIVNTVSIDSFNSYPEDTYACIPYMGYKQVIIHPTMNVNFTVIGDVIEADDNG